MSSKLQVKNVGGRMVTVRALVDEGSDTSLASVTFIRKLGFTGKKGLRIAGVLGRDSVYELE